METTTFYETFRKAVQGKLPSYEVRLETITKNNGVNRPALVVRKQNSTIGVTTYIEFFEAQYEQGAALDELVEKYLDVYRDELFETTLSVDDLYFLNDKNTLLDMVFYRIINRGKNELLLENAPWSEVIEDSDIVMTYSILVSSDETGMGTITITNALMESLGLDFEDVKRHATQNTPRLLPYTFKNLGEVLGGIFDDETLLPLYVLSNESNHFGSSALAHPELIDQIADTLGCSIFILPSSIHELLILRDDGSFNATSLREMVECVNLSEVKDDELLSNECYYYDAINKILSVA